MISIIKQNDRIILEYTSRGENSWVLKTIKKYDFITIRKVFTFTIEDVLEEQIIDDDDNIHDEYSPVKFILGVREGDYYRINSNILGTQHDILLSKDMNLDRKKFIAHTDICIFSRIDHLISEQIIIGGKNDKAIPIEAFNNLIQQFPTSTEVRHYASTRVTLILKDYLETMTNAQEKLSNYLKKKKILNKVDENNIDIIYELEIKKYEYIRDRIKEELKQASAYSESDWQKLMLHFILLIFPKYIGVLENLHIRDFYSKKDKTTNRYIDITLIDASGNIDIIEIKKPFADCLVPQTPYRDNFVPKKELSGSIMQAEKYIFHLNKWGVAGEKEINKKRQKDIPKGIEVKITNPKALIIIGRSNKLSDRQNFDLELIKRKYSNIMDIITYDDLINRLDNIIRKLKRK